MRGREFERYARHSLLPRLPAGFTARRSLVFKVTAGNVLHGITTDSSAFTTDFYVWVFVQPLYVPSEYIVLNFGDRVGGGARRWSRDEMQGGSLTEAVVSAAPALFTRIGEPAGLARAAEQTERNSRHAEVAGRSWFAVGDNARAVRALRVAAGTTDPRDWAQELGRRCAAFADLIERDPSAAEEEHHRVISSTRAALRLT
jgi:hypothetical protein